MAKNIAPADPVILRSSGVLTNSYVAGSSVPIPNWNQITLFCTVTKGSATDVRIQLEFSPDGVTWFGHTSITTGTDVSGIQSSTVARHEYLFDTADSYAVPVPVAYRFMRINAKCTGTATGSNLLVSLAPGVV